MHLKRGSKEAGQNLYILGLQWDEWIWQYGGCALPFERMRGLPNGCCMPDGALCCSEKSKGRSRMQIQRKFWEKRIQERRQCTLSHSALVMEDAETQEPGIHCSGEKGPSCAIVWLTSGVTWRCNSSSKTEQVSPHYLQSAVHNRDLQCGATVGGVSLAHSHETVRSLWSMWFIPHITGCCPLNNLLLSLSLHQLSQLLLYRL